MLDELDPIPDGELGTVVSAEWHGEGKDAWCQIDVEWDNGRQLMLVCPPDQYEVIHGTLGTIERGMK